MKEVKEKHNYVDPKDFKESLRVYYECDKLTDDLAENIILMLTLILSLTLLQSPSTHSLIELKKKKDITKR